MNLIPKHAFYKTRLISRYIGQGLLARRPHISYIGAWHETQNLGDKALATSAELLFPQCGFIDYPYNRPEEFYQFAKRLRFIKYGLLAGGTLINRTPRALKMAAECFPMCKKSFVFGSGVANPDFWQTRPHWKSSLDQWKPILDSCSYIGVRGPLSVKALKDAGIENVEAIGDPILVCAEKWSKPPAYNEKTIGLSISHPGILPHEDMWGTMQSLQQQYIKLATIARESGWKVKWLIADKQETELVTSLANQSDTAQDISDCHGDYKTYLDLVRPLSVFVGMKLHSVAIATCAYVPSIMCEYRPKCRDYMSYIGQGDNTIRADKFDAEEVWQKVKQMNSERDSYSQNLYNSINPLKEKQIAKAKQLISDMESGRR